ncbi:MAG TPA: copper resistance protein CopC [Dermatophilaceae bacterium]|nr:copper resistance protein CopC [Dermatophilaceae bacterium]
MRWRGEVPRAGRVTRRLVPAAALAVLVGIGLPGTAQAHAQLERTDPGAGAVLATAPAAVTLDFTEPVEPADGAVEVFDDTFDPVATGPVTRGLEGARSLRVALRDRLGPGTYTVSWHVSSTDTHPISGSFRFSVGATSVVRGTLPDRGRNEAAGAMLWVLRWLGYLGLVLGPGALLAAMAVWPQVLAERRARRLVGAGLVVLAASTLGGMALQGVWASGVPVSALWTAPETLDTHSRRFDQVYAVRAYLVLGFAAVAAATLASGGGVVRWRRPLPVAVGVATVALLSTWPLVGHPSAGAGAGLAIGVNLLHTLAMTVWLGGLLLLVRCALPVTDPAGLARALRAFSRVALACVAALVVTGGLMSWREVSSVAALTGTTFGRLLIGKLAGVLVLVLLGNLARRWVDRQLPTALTVVPAAASAALPAGPRRKGAAVAVPAVSAEGLASLARLRRGMAGEVVAASLVLAATAALVVITPARTDYVAPFAATVSAGGARVEVGIDAPRVGDAVVRVRLADARGREQRITAVSGAVAPSGQALAGPDSVLPMSGRPTSDGPVEVGVRFAAVGAWQVHLVVSPAAGSPASVTVTVPVGPAQG